MKTIIMALIATTAIGLCADAQTVSTDSAKGFPLPVITVNERMLSLQSSLYPGLYLSASVIDDFAWVRKHDSVVINFVQTYQDTILQALTEYSGVSWREDTLNLSLLRYYPSLGSADPLVFPLGGIRTGALSEAIPEGTIQQLGLIYLLAQRLLLNGLRPEAPTFDLLTNHPLMQPTPLRRDNFAYLLALAVSERALGVDSTRKAHQSPFWKRHLLGRDLFDQYLNRQWVLSKDRPLTRWLAEEVADSRLVEISELTIEKEAGTGSRKRQMIEGVSPTGRLGFSVRIGAGNQLVIDKIDSSRSAYKCGLRSGDVVKLVDSKKPKNHKDLIELILNQLESGGAMLAVTRGGKSETVFVRASASK